MTSHVDIYTSLAQNYMIQITLSMSAQLSQTSKAKDFRTRVARRVSCLVGGRQLLYDMMGYSEESSTG